MCSLVSIVPNSSETCACIQERDMPPLERKLKLVFLCDPWAHVERLMEIVIAAVADTFLNPFLPEGFKAPQFWPTTALSCYLVLYIGARIFYFSMNNQYTFLVAYTMT